MTYNAILSELKSKKYSPIYFLESDEAFYIDQIVDQIENNVLDEGEKAFNQVVLYGKETDFQQVLDQVMQFPMMSSHRVVILKEAQEMRGFEKLTGYFNNPSASSILVIAYKNKKFDKRKKKTWDALKKNAVILETKRIYDNQLPGIIKQLGKDNAINIGDKEATLMAEHIGSDLNRINNEIIKLRSVLKEGEILSTDHIQEYIGINKEYNIFELQNALGSKDKTKCQKIIYFFSKNAKTNPIQMHIGALYNYFSKLYLAKKFARGDKSVLASKLKVSPYFVNDYRSASLNYKVDELNQIFKALHQMDKRSKGIESRHFDYLGAYQEFIHTALN